jgi:hypothetical protein
LSAEQPREAQLLEEGDSVTSLSPSDFVWFGTLPQACVSNPRDTLWTRLLVREPLLGLRVQACRELWGRIK